ncbi:MAG: DUF948 domain-containing protein [Syntrophaceae bacterium]|nr:DUF948 domain-containing protein [Syntrophaceae bacterium]
MLEISFVILSIAFLLLAGSLAAVFFQLWRMMRRLFPTIDELNRRLPNILRDVEELTANIKGTSTHVHLQVENISRLLSQAQACLAVIPVVEGKLREGLIGTRNLTALWKGITVFVRTFVSGGQKEN